jgi:hypothetical protein
MPLWVPRAVAPAYNCEVCGATYTEAEEEKYIRHVPKCVAKHREVVDEMVENSRRPDPLEQAIDQEAVEFQKRRYGS